MSSTAAVRQRRYLHRQLRGEVVVPIVVDEHRATARLVQVGLLDETQLDDRAAVQAAVQRIIDIWLR